MQLGELQSQLNRFIERGANVVAISVDPPKHSQAMIQRMGLTFAVVSDEDQSIMRSYGVRNPDTQQLALHAVFIVSQEAQVIYRKVASRRPLAQELLDAIDYYEGIFPMGDGQVIRNDIEVAFPRNNFQALIEVSANGELPSSVTTEIFEPVLALLRSGQSDDAIVLYRQVVAELSKSLNETELLATSAWLVKTARNIPSEALATGLALNRALVRQRTLRQVEPVDNIQIAEVQKDIDVLRGVIRKNANEWQLRSTKATLRGYREIALASQR